MVLLSIRRHESQINACIHKIGIECSVMETSASASEYKKVQRHTFIPIMNVKLMCYLKQSHHSALGYSYSKKKQLNNHLLLLFLEWGAAE